MEPQRNGTESQGTVSLVIENLNAYPVFLPANQLIGYLQPARCLSQDEAAKVLHSQVNVVSTNSHANSVEMQAIWEQFMWTKQICRMRSVLHWRLL